MIPDMLGCYNMMKKYNILVIYNGSVWAGGIEGYAETLKRRLAFDELPLSASQSVFSVFVEQMNNMLMYSEEKERCGKPGKGAADVPMGLFLLGEDENTYILQSGNVIKNKNAESVKARIEHLNTLDKKELRQFYRERMKSGNDNPESKGAGLGLIEIARRADAPIEYSFTPFDEGLSFFTMLVKISKGEK